MKTDAGDAIEDGDAAALEDAVAGWTDSANVAVRLLDGDVDRVDDMENRKPEERTKAHKWIHCLDSMMHKVTGRNLIPMFEKDFSQTIKPTDDATQWPRMCVTPDAGSDGVSALYYLMSNKPKGLGLNISAAYDISHGCWNDAKQSLRRVGLWSDIYILLLCHNVSYRGFDVWYSVQRQALSQYFKMLRPKTDPVLNALMDDLFEALQWSHRKGEEGIEQEVAEVLKTSSTTWSKGGKASLVRWWGVIDQTMHNVEHGLIPQCKLMCIVMLVG